MTLKESNNAVWNTNRFATYTGRNTKASRRFVQSGNANKEIAAQVPVCLATVYRWINLPKHKNVKQKAEPKTEDSSAGGDSKKSVNTDNINSETALLEAQIKELKAQLRAAELKACAYETMVNVAEKKFGIAIRKKHGAKQ